MSFTLSSLWKDLARWRRDYLALLIWVGLPLMLGGLITALMGTDVRPHGTLLLADEDQTFLSELIVGAYTAGELGEFITVEKTSVEDGLARLNDDEASALLVIPQGFAAAFIEAEPVTLRLRTNPSQTILPDIIRNVTEVLLDAGFYAHELFGDEIATLASMTAEPDDAQVAALAVAIRNKVATVAERLLPPVIDVEIVEPEPEQAGPPLAMLYMPGVILMSVMFAANGLAADLWREREQGTLRRLVSTPARLGGFLAGKALAVGVIVVLLSGFTLLLGFLYHGIAWGHFPVALLWLAIAGIALFAWFAVLQMLFDSRRTASIISTLLVVPLLMAGGSFFPLAVMPGWIAAIGRAAPNGFVADRLTTELLAAAPGAIGLDNWLIVVAAAITGLAICSWRLRTGFARP